MNEGELVSNPQQIVNFNNGCNSVKTLPDDAGFKIVPGLSEKMYAYQCLKSKLPLKENVKFLSEWSFNAKVIKSSWWKSSRVILSLTGTLLKEDQATVSEKYYDAGVLQTRKKRNLVKTSNGLYHLIGNIIGGSPLKLYQTCLAEHGIPRNWKVMTNKLYGTEDLSLDSSNRPIKLVTPKITADLSMHFIGNETAYNKNEKPVTLESLKLNEPKSKIDQCKLHKKAATKSTDQTLRCTNNYIVKKKRSSTKERALLMSKEQVPVSMKEKLNEHTSTELDIFSHINVASDVDFIMGSPETLSVSSASDRGSLKSKSPLFDNWWDAIDISYSSPYSNPPSPVNKSIEAKALKRIKAPYKKATKKYSVITLKNNKEKKKFNKLLEFRDDYG